MLSVSTFTHETRPVAFSSRTLIFLPIILVIVLHFFPFAIAFISRVVFLTHVTVAKVVFAVVPRVFTDGDTFMCPVSLRDVVALGGEVVSSCIVYSGFAILITLLLWGTPCKKQLFFKGSIRWCWTESNFQLSWTLSNFLKRLRIRLTITVWF